MVDSCLHCEIEQRCLKLRFDIVDLRIKGIGMDFIRTKNAPAAIGPYSQAVKHSGVLNNLLFCSGQIPLDPDTMEVVAGGVKEQTKQVLKNLQAVLAKAGFSKMDVVKTTVFLKDMNSFAEMNGAYDAFFQGHKPARAAVEVSRLPKDALVEIECIAVKQ